MPQAAVIILCKTLGLAPFTLLKSRKIYTLYTLIILFGYYYLLFVSETVGNPLRLLQDILNISTLTACMAMGLFCAEGVIKMDKSVKSIQRGLKHNRFTYVWIAIAVILTIFNVTSGVIMDGFDGSVYYVSNLCVTVYCLYFYALLTVIYDYLGRLRVNFIQIHTEVFMHVRIARLLAIRKAYSRIYSTCRMINWYYNVPLTFVFASSFVNITHNAFDWMKVDYKGEYLRLCVSISWMLVNCIRLVLIANVCEDIKIKVQGLAVTIHDCLVDIDDEDEHTLILQFSLQLIQENIEFWACGLFKLDNSLLFGMLAAVTTYSVLIFQLSVY